MTELQLDTLESKGLIRLATIDPELEYLFRHALVQDAAYGSLLKQERRLLHRQVGEALELLYPERHAELAALLARHFEQAGDHDRAVEYLVQAAQYANERNAVAEAHDLYSRARELLPPADGSDTQEMRRRRLEINFGWVRSGFGLLSQDEQLSQLEPLIDEAARLGDVRLEADVRLHDALLRMFEGQRPADNPHLAATLERVDSIAVELGDPVIAALPKSIVGLFQVFTGELREGVRTLQEAAPLLEQKHDFVGSSFALMALATGLARLGRFEEAERASARSIEVAREGDIIARIDAMIGKSAIAAIRGDFETAVPIAMECTQMAEDSGATACVVSSAYLAGDALLQQKRFADAQIALDRSITISGVTNERMFGPVASASLHSVAASLGQLPLKGQSIDQALAETRESHDAWAEATVLWRRGETEGKRPDGDQAQMLADFAAASAIFQEMGARPFEARVLRDWGYALRSIGRLDEGNAKLRAALGILDELGIEREAEEVRAQLAVA
jgi:tetratricopeptide (TPR) repeat protein